MTRMKILARGIVWWPKLDDEIELMVRSCSVCQTQSDNPPVAPLIPWQWPSQPWHRLHIKTHDSESRGQEEPATTE